MTTSAAPVEPGDGPGAIRLQVFGADKRFGSTQALSGVDLDIAEGEVHALTGGNGSGKSTLIKCLAGVYTADAGRVVALGDEHDLASITPTVAKGLGLSFVHQDAGVFPDMTVAENLVVGSAYPHRAGLIDWKALRRSAQAVLDRHEIDVDAKAMVGDLGPATRMQIAVARCLENVVGDDTTHGDRPVLVLDEPTASLPPHEVEQLVTALRGYARRGASVLIVTHRFDEVFALADRVTVMRDGIVSGRADVAAITHAELVTMMLGRRDVTGFYADQRANAPGEVVLSVRGLGSGQLRDIDLEIRAGEIVGVVGLLGSGRSRLLKSMFGADDRTGEVAVDGAVVPAGSVKAAMAAGVAYVPEDRLARGVFLDQTVEDNLSLGQLATYRRGIGWSARSAREAASEARDEFAIKTESTLSLVSSLSGGNQQKVVLARWLSRRPRLILLDEPTQEVDVGSKSQIYDFVRTAAADSAVLVASSDVEELCHLCDRVVFLAGGRLVAEMSQPLTAPQLVDQLMTASEKS